VADEVVVNVGEGDDGTWEAVRDLGSDRIKPFRSVWDPRPRAGAVLSEQTNLALARCTGHWVVYLQADEVLHEDDLDGLKRRMRAHASDDVEGLVFDYLHFFGSPHLIHDDWLAFYPRAVRALKRRADLVSVGDAAGFARVIDGEGPRGLIKARADARIFHYGWADPGKLERAVALSAMYHERGVGRSEDLLPRDLTARSELRLFEGCHPESMRDRVLATPRPEAPRSHRTPAWFRAWRTFLAAPRTHLQPARAFLPLWLTNLKWRLAARSNRGA
jgi:glycosyltransferase involved in cell wall biosynthesis